MNPLAGVPFLLVVGGMLFPLLFLDAGPRYVTFLWGNPLLAILLAVNWSVVGYWTARRLAETLFLRSAGAKLRATRGSS